MKTIWRKPNASKKLRKKSGGAIKVWMLRKICESDPRFGESIRAGWMEGALNVMSWSPNEAAKMAKEYAYAARVYRGVVERHQRHHCDIEQKRVNNMFREVGL